MGCGAGRERGMAVAGRSGGAAARERNGKTSGGGDVAQGHEDSMLRRCVEFRSDGDE